MLNIRPAAECRWDIVSLGEVMLRLDPGDGRIRTARRFDVWEGGGEYNVARGLSRCFGQRAALVSALARNEVGWLLESLIRAGGVDMSHVLWREFDGIGRRTRNGLNFTERGFGVRGAIGVSDRGHTAASQLEPGQIDWRELFERQGVRWFHTGGIFAGLSATTPLVIEEAVTAARAAGTIVSYDLNYRPSLWRDGGGQGACQAVNQRLAPHVDVMIGNEEDFSACLGIPLAAPVEDAAAELSVAPFAAMLELARARFPQWRVAATTLRGVQTATRNDWGAVCWAGGELYQAPWRRGLEIWDRVGGGDSFASGLIYGFLAGLSPQEAVEYGAAHGALAMTTPGDTSMVSLDEVRSLVRGSAPRVQR
jgi:2-dehydro-3-deoxygluconokinase